MSQSTSMTITSVNMIAQDTTKSKASVEFTSTTQTAAEYHTLISLVAVYTTVEGVADQGQYNSGSTDKIKYRAISRDEFVEGSFTIADLVAEKQYAITIQAEQDDNALLLSNTELTTKNIVKPNTMTMLTPPTESSNKVVVKGDFNSGDNTLGLPSGHTAKNVVVTVAGQQHTDNTHSYDRIAAYAINSYVFVIDYSAGYNEAETLVLNPNNAEDNTDNDNHLPKADGFYLKDGTDLAFSVSVGEGESIDRFVINKNSDSGNFYFNEYSMQIVSTEGGSSDVSNSIQSAGDPKPSAVQNLTVTFTPNSGDDISLVLDADAPVEMQSGNPNGLRVRYCPYEDMSAAEQAVAGSSYGSADTVSFAAMNAVTDAFNTARWTELDYNGTDANTNFWAGSGVAYTTDKDSVSLIGQGKVLFFAQAYSLDASGVKYYSDDAKTAAGVWDHLRSPAEAVTLVLGSNDYLPREVNEDEVGGNGTNLEFDIALPNVGGEVDDANVLRKPNYAAVFTKIGSNTSAWKENVLLTWSGSSATFNVDLTGNHGTAVAETLENGDTLEVQVALFDDNSFTEGTVDLNKSAAYTFYPTKEHAAPTSAVAPSFETAPLPNAEPLITYSVTRPANESGLNHYNNGLVHGIVKVTWTNGSLQTSYIDLTDANISDVDNNGAKANGNGDIAVNDLALPWDTLGGYNVPYTLYHADVNSDYYQSDDTSDRGVSFSAILGTLTPKKIALAPSSGTATEVAVVGTIHVDVTESDIVVGDPADMFHVRFKVNNGAEYQYRQVATSADSGDNLTRREVADNGLHKYALTGFANNDAISELAVSFSDQRSRLLDSYDIVNGQNWLEISGTYNVQDVPNALTVVGGKLYLLEQIEFDFTAPAKDLLPYTDMYVSLYSDDARTQPIYDTADNINLSFALGEVTLKDSTTFKSVDELVAGNIYTASIAVASNEDIKFIGAQQVFIDARLVNAAGAGESAPSSYEPGSDPMIILSLAQPTQENNSAPVAVSQLDGRTTFTFVLDVFSGRQDNDIHVSELPPTHLRYQLSTANDFSFIDKTDDLVYDASGNYTITGLTAGTTYYLRTAFIHHDDTYYNDAGTYMNYKEADAPFTTNDGTLDGVPVLNGITVDSGSQVTLNVTSPASEPGLTNGTMEVLVNVVDTDYTGIDAAESSAVVVKTVSMDWATTQDIVITGFENNLNLTGTNSVGRATNPTVLDKVYAGVNYSYSLRYNATQTDGGRPLNSSSAAQNATAYEAVRLQSIERNNGLLEIGVDLYGSPMLTIHQIHSAANNANVINTSLLAAWDAEHIVGEDSLTAGTVLLSNIACVNEDEADLILLIANAGGVELISLENPVNGVVYGRTGENTFTSMLAE